MRDPKLDELLKALPFGPKHAENGRAPMFRFLPADDVLVMEKFRAMEVGHGAGVDDGVQKLLAAKTKRDAKKFARALVLTGQSIFDLVANCGGIEYVHAEGHRRDMPEGRALSPEERAAFFYPRGAERDPKVGAKLRDGYREQTHLSWHAFTNANVWHCFFYSARDVRGDPFTGKTHSPAFGSHVHYASHLTDPPSLDEFVQRMRPGADLRHEIHIRFQSSFTEKDFEGCEELLG